MHTQRTPFAKIFGISGIVLGLFYMVFTVASPHLKGSEMPVSSMLLRFVALSPFFGAFGLAIGTGLGLLLDGLLNKKKPTPDKSSPPEA